MDFLFVRWFKRDTTAKRLQHLQFFKDDSPDAYGFLDPECVIQGIHIILGFAFGHPEGLLIPTIGRHKSDPDWVLYYVNMFVDRDMFMRFRGGAVGHKGMREWDDILQREGHVPEDSDDETEDMDEAAITEEFDEDGIAEGDKGDADEDECDEEDEEGNNNEIEEDDDDGLMDNDEDEIIADDGKELDDNILIEEGYGAL
ncbi:hypothetical protein BDR04DRAFT_1155262 [Suillus decipiens]|nr:hypothetical protein BDR04DRAFT_1155262 [Suillus decipiens]